jgi:hypothetical protein
MDNSSNSSSSSKKVERKRRRRRRRSSGTKPLPFGSLVRHARLAIKGKVAGKGGKSMRQAIQLALSAAKKFKKGKTIRPAGKGDVFGERVLPLPKTGGVLPLLPIFAGLSALGTLAGGAAGVAKAITEAKDAKRRLGELQRHNETMEAIALRKGSGLFLKPYRKGLGLYMKPYSKITKNY